MTARQYAYNKLSLKLNLLLSSGKKRSGVIDSKVIDKLMNSYSENHSNYEIVWDMLKIFPISLSPISNDVISIDGKYFLNYSNPQIRRCIFTSQYIEFKKSEFIKFERNQKLKNILNDRAS
jgi:hypothetical protein